MPQFALVLVGELDPVSQTRLRPCVTMGPVVVERDDDELVALLLGNDPVEGTGRPAGSTDATIEVRIGDLAVVHTPDEVARRRRGAQHRGAWYAIFAVAAAAVALLVGLVPRLVQSSSGSSDQLAVSPLHPSSPAKAAPAHSTTTPPPVHPHPAKSLPALPATTGYKPSSSPRAHVPVAPPPAPLSVTMSLSGTKVQAGSSITVHYSWSDGNGRLLYVNAIGLSAVKVVRPPACAGHAPAPKPSKGSGSWIFALPFGQPGLIEGVTFPFDHPERIKVGVQIGTGAQCVPVEEKTVTQWVTLYPSPAVTPSTTPSGAR